jgi:hypothetical protein
MKRTKSLDNLTKDIAVPSQNGGNFASNLKASMFPEATILMINYLISKCFIET